MLINLRNALMAGKKSPLPPGARWVEYLESDGGQYVDTGVVPVFPDELTYAARVYYYNTQTRSIQGRQGSFYFGVIYQKLQPGLGGAAYVNVAILPATWYDVTCKYTTGQYPGAYGTVDYDVGGTSGSVTNGFSDAPAGGPIWLFIANNATTLRGQNRLAKFSIYRRGALVRDFHPIAIGTTGYMLDLVSGDYLQYGNKGTGDFVIGPDTNAPAI